MDKRENWSSWTEFLFSCIGSLVGLGNIWRFPYLCFKNGGGAFLIPYVVFLVVVGMPVVYMEMAYCQFSNLSPAKAWICVPLLRGIGIGMVSIVLIAAMYYNIIISWTIYYFASSFRRSLPWTTCDNPWNTDACYLRLHSNNNVTKSIDGFRSLNGGNLSSARLNITRVTASEEFWDNNVLGRTAGIEDLGSIKWELLLCLFAAWLLVVLCLVRGIKSSGKVMYVAATLPYALLLVLLVRALTLEGAMDGLRYYMVPKWEELASITVWGDAAIQMFFSLSIGGGASGTLASYNKFHNNVQRDAILIPCIDLFTSWFAGCVIFTSLGFMAKAANLNIEDVVSQGPGIAFLVYPEALSQLPLPQLWSVIFFLMLVVVGLDSQIVNIQVVVSTLTDHFPTLLGKRQITVTAAICFALFILGIPCVTQGGVYVLQVLDWYLSAIAVVLLPFFEVIGLGWFYGVDRLCRDIAMMLGHEISPLWKVCWKYVTPLTMMMIWVFGVSMLKTVSYGGITFPNWAVGLGWTVAAIPIIVTFTPTVLELRKAEGMTLMQKIRSSLPPHKDWGPADENCRDLYRTCDGTRDKARDPQELVTLQ